MQCSNSSKALPTYHGHHCGWLWLWACNSPNTILLKGDFMSLPFFEPAVIFRTVYSASSPAPGGVSFLFLCLFVSFLFHSGPSMWWYLAMNFLCASLMAVDVGHLLCVFICHLFMLFDCVFKYFAHFRLNVWLLTFEFIVIYVYSAKNVILIVNLTQLRISLKQSQWQLSR